MTDVELDQFKRLKTIYSALSTALTILIPFAMINLFSVKYDAAKYTPAFRKTMLLLGVFGVGVAYTGNQ